MKLKNLVSGLTKPFGLKAIVNYLVLMVACIPFFSPVAGANDTIQINVKSTLVCRAVTTYSNGKLYTWNKGVDGGGGGDGLLTVSAALHQGNPASHALSGQWHFPGQYFASANCP